MCRPRLFDPIPMNRGGKGRLKGRGLGANLCRRGLYITVPKQLVVWSMSSLKFILFERRGRTGTAGIITFSLIFRHPVLET